MKKLDQYLSNLVVGNIRLHNLHWNLEGIHFKEVHEYIEAVYDEAFTYLDEVAELQKMLGHTPLTSLKQYLENTTLEELTETKFTDIEAIKLTLDYIQHMSKLALEIREEAGENDNFAVANMLEDHLAAYLKHEWFLNSMLKRA